ncbi:MAG TPA: hypothetical protein VJT09_05835 [Pyrinomonadaceae bacterium]|nr:hypothetical protein [Pyrinomonadaceae bacterium]
MKRALFLLLLLAGLYSVAAPRAADKEDASVPDVSVISFDWKYAGYQSAETVSENSSNSNSTGATGYKASRKTVYVFKYTARATLKNTGGKTIKAVSWEYVFRDAKDEKELKRYNLQSRQEILPGETQTITRDVGLDPKESTRHITTGKQSVEITRIEYTDGTVWRRQKSSEE